MRSRTSRRLIRGRGLTRAPPSWPAVSIASTPILASPRSRASWLEGDDAARFMAFANIEAAMRHFDDFRRYAAVSDTFSRQVDSVIASRARQPRITKPFISG